MDPTRTPLMLPRRVDRLLRSRALAPSLAASRIKRFLRGIAFSRSLRSLSSRLQRANLIGAWPPSAEFKAVVDRSRSKWFLRDLRKFISSITYLISRKIVISGSTVQEEEELRPMNIRVLMTVVLIVNRPESCFEGIGELERKVQASARPVYDSLCQLLDQTQRLPLKDIPWAEHRPFLRQLRVYFDNFAEWKIPDEKKLTDRIRHALLALYRSESHLKGSENDYSNMKQEFKTQKLKLRAKLVQLAGQQGLEAFDKELQQQDFYTPSDDSSETLPEDGNGSAVLSQLPGRMTNEQLAHELLLDPTFKLDTQGAGYIDDGTLAKIRDSFKIAFWDSLVDDLRVQPPCYTRVLNVIGEVRDGIIDLAPSRKKELSEKIDVGFWKQQIDIGALDWPSCVGMIDGMVKICLQMQTGERNKETLEAWKLMEPTLRSTTPEEQPKAFCDALQYALDRVNAMRVDAANARLRNIAHVIQQHGIEYEQAHMDKKLKSNPSYLQLTPGWILETISSVSEKDNEMLAKLSRGDGVAFEQIQAEAILRLVTAEQPVTNATCPEIVLLDLSRLQKLHASLRFDVFACATMGMASQRLLIKGNSTSVQGFLQHLKTALNGFDASRLSPEEAKVAFLDSFSSELSETEKQAVSATYTPEVLRQLLNAPKLVTDKAFKPVVDQWRKIVVGRCYDTPTSPLLLNVHDRITRNAKELLRAVDINRRVHSAIYNDLIAKKAAVLNE